jgi:hypothetical protein
MQKSYENLYNINEYDKNKNDFVILIKNPNK